MNVGKAVAAKREGSEAEALQLVSKQLTAACAPCPERRSDLARACLCPCQVAVARCFLATAASSGPDPARLDTESRGELVLQSWAASGRPGSCEMSAIEKGHADLGALHGSCELSGCLVCEARARLEDLLTEARTGSRS